MKATTKLTRVATIVGPHPTPLEMLLNSVIPSRIAAPVSAGIARKNDSRVTATRSISRRRPADIVAPDRETPGISATHWTMPMIRVSSQVTSDSCRRRVARLSA